MSRGVPASTHALTIDIIHAHLTTTRVVINERVPPHEHVLDWPDDGELALGLASIGCPPNTLREHNPAECDSDIYFILLECRVDSSPRDAIAVDASHLIDPLVKAAEPSLLPASLSRTSSTASSYDRGASGLFGNYHVMAQEPLPTIFKTPRLVKASRYCLYYDPKRIGHWSHGN